MSNPENYDFALIGGGIMSATLGVMLKIANPKINLVMLERLNQVAQESSDAWNNAGTGHAALCELNYMPDSKDGSLPDPAKAIAINEQFQISRAFWAYCVERGILAEPSSFIRTTPHMTFVRGDKDVDYLRRRFEALKPQPLFAGMKYSEDLGEIADWAPLLVDGRASTDRVAATWIEQGTDVDYGAITRQLVDWLCKQGMRLETGSEVKALHQFPDGRWQLWLGSSSQRIVTANKVFVGAGGWALKLMQSAKLPEIEGYGTFPVSGHFLRTDNQDLVSLHLAKVYSQAAVGAPPMSVPHLDTRVVDGKTSLLFGPFAGINPKFLKSGSVLDLPRSVRIKNLLPYLSVALKNFSLLVYLIREVTKSRSKKFDSLREFVPDINESDWSYYEAGQRAQIIKPSGRLGTLQFGTEVIAGGSASIAGLLGASPGASVSVSVMLDVLDKLDLTAVRNAVESDVEGLSGGLNASAAAAKKHLARTAKILGLQA